MAACSKTTDTPVSLTIESDMVLIPAGQFLMGSDKTDKEGKSKEFGFVQPLYVDEHPQHTVNLPAFWIDKYETSNAEFLKFFQETQANVSQQGVEKQRSEQSDWNNLPVSQVTWYQAQGYCMWLGKRLPTEQEWEKAARGPEGREYPWGNTWNENNLNKGSADNESGVVRVGSYLSGVSYYGVHDLAGNVAEWVSDWYQMYPGGTFQSSYVGKSHKVVRGGGWGGVGHYVIPVLFRGAHRDYEKPDRLFNDIGFRCVKDT